MRTTLALLGLLVATAACGGERGGDGVATLSGGTASPSATASADPDAAFRAFAKCMREHGVEMPDPGEDGGLVMAPSAAPREVGEAEKACNVHLKAVLREGPKMDDPEMLDRAVRFARCMREHGVDLPDPGPNGAIVKKGGGGDVKPPFDPADPTFKAAQKACGGLLGPNVEEAG